MEGRAAVWVFPDGVLTVERARLEGKRQEALEALIDADLALRGKEPRWSGSCRSCGPSIPRGSGSPSS